VTVNVSGEVKNAFSIIYSKKWQKLLNLRQVHSELRILGYKGRKEDTYCPAPTERLSALPLIKKLFAPDQPNLCMDKQH